MQFSVGGLITNNTFYHALQTSVLFIIRIVYIFPIDSSKDTYRTLASIHPSTHTCIRIYQHTNIYTYIHTRSWSP